MRKTKIIIINSQKGGSLKSTTASNVSGLLSLREDTKVCLVDLDSQNDISPLKY
ncbi:AAA family ATPase [Vagococcus fluvialis]|uniref:AAA family ATPase n=1 Tax=Vagococcus fluvialis TaxID=2738 RepID=UPI001D0A8F1E|nr:ParA family protein [Vagococcus fluvialis]UDM84080.1 ParA family protein [Vagococcus fluvialis]